MRQRPPSREDSGREKRAPCLQGADRQPPPPGLALVAQRFDLGLVTSEKIAFFRIEVCGLRVKDLDFACGEILVRDGKGGKDRRTTLPKSIQEGLKIHLNQVRRRHERDLAAGAGRVVL